jgi:hypothetical protein
MGSEMSKHKISIKRAIDEEKRFYFSEYLNANGNSLIDGISSISYNFVQLGSID